MGWFSTPTQAIFYTTLVATPFQDQDCWLKRPYKNWQVSAFWEAWLLETKTPILGHRTPHNSDMNISNNKIMVPICWKTISLLWKVSIHGPYGLFLMLPSHNFAKSPKHFPLQRSRESQEIRDGKVPKSQLAGLQKRMSPWCLAPARTARTAKTARARMNCSSGWGFLLSLYADFWICLQFRYLKEKPKALKPSPSFDGIETKVNNIRQNSIEIDVLETSCSLWLQVSNRCLWRNAFLGTFVAYSNGTVSYDSCHGSFFWWYWLYFRFLSKSGFFQLFLSSAMVAHRSLWSALRASLI